MSPIAAAVIAAAMVARKTITWGSRKPKTAEKHGKVSVSAKAFQLASCVTVQPDGEATQTHVRALSDPGANVAVFNKKSHFIPGTLRKPGKGEVHGVKTASGRLAKARMLGTVAVKVQTSYGHDVIYIEGALYVPEFDLNIVSE